MDFSDDTLMHLNPGVVPFMRRVVDAIRQGRAAPPAGPVVLSGPAEPPRLPMPVAELRDVIGLESETETESMSDTDDIPCGANHAAAEDGLVRCSEYAASTSLSLQTTVPLPLGGRVGFIKYRKNIAYGKVLLARLAGRYPIRGFFFMLSEKTANCTTDGFVRMYGEITKEANVGSFVLPRNVVQEITETMHVRPKQSITITAAARGIDPGPGYKFDVPASHFALLVTTPPHA